MHIHKIYQHPAKENAPSTRTIATIHGDSARVIAFSVTDPEALAQTCREEPEKIDLLVAVPRCFHAPGGETYKEKLEYYEEYITLPLPEKEVH